AWMKWTSAVGGTSESRPAAAMEVPTTTDRPGFRRSPSHSRWASPGKRASRSAMSSRTVRPVASTRPTPFVRRRSGLGMKTVGMREWSEVRRRRSANSIPYSLLPIQLSPRDRHRGRVAVQVAALVFGAWLPPFDERDELFDGFVVGPLAFGL